MCGGGAGAVGGGGGHDGLRGGARGHQCRTVGGIVVIEAHEPVNGAAQSQSETLRMETQDFLKQKGALLRKSTASIIGHITQHIMHFLRDRDIDCSAVWPWNP